MTTAQQEGTRRFEFSDGNSNKFWEIRRNGNEVTIRFGRIDMHRQSHEKSFPNDAAAARHASKLVREELAKGYLAVG
jgi:predicted DNA-binding WGR domain protein